MCDNTIDTTSSDDLSKLLAAKKTQRHCDLKPLELPKSIGSALFEYTLKYENATVIRTSQLTKSGKKYPTAKIIEQYIFQAPCYPKHELLYHGVEPDEPLSVINKLESGCLYPLKMLCSFSSSLESATKWAREGSKILFKLDNGTPLGTTVATVSEHMEYEVLLSGANLLRVKGTEIKSDLTFISMEYVGCDEGLLKNFLGMTE